jgi:ornithine cyclodeaminase/alanine dehydrogenase-like protein (mu-crystallin family)
MMDAAPMFSIPNPALLLSRSDVVRLMNTHDYLHAFEAAFRSHAGGGAHMPLPVHIPVEAGGFHAKGARIVLDRVYVALKLNANFPGNPHTKGLPTIQGVVLLCDASDGSLLAVMDSIEITLRRTAAASALAARFLARKDAHRIAVCGCGEQGRAQLVALAQVMPLEMARVWDVDADKASAFARDMGEALHLDVRAVKEAADATRASDVIVTATSARTPYLTRDMVAPGTFVAAVGADSPDKSELAPGLMARAKIVVDVLEQCVVMGDLHHAIAAGMVAPGDVHATLGELAAGRRPGRTDRDEIFVFDSTGTGLQDAASAAWIYQRARAGNIGTSIVFAH